MCNSNLRFRRFARPGMTVGVIFQSMILLFVASNSMPAERAALVKKSPTGSGLSLACSAKACSRKSSARPVGR